MDLTAEKVRAWLGQVDEMATAISANAPELLDDTKQSACTALCNLLIAQQYLERMLTNLSFDEQCERVVGKLAEGDEPF